MKMDVVDRLIMDPGFGNSNFFKYLYAQLLHIIPEPAVVDQLLYLTEGPMYRMMFFRMVMFVMMNFVMLIFCGTGQNINPCTTDPVSHIFLYHQLIILQR